MTRHSAIHAICMVLLIGFSVPTSALAQTPAQDNAKAVNDAAVKFFGSGKLQEYGGKIKSIASRLTERNRQVRAATRFALFYLEYARQAKSEVDFKTLDLMYPQFKNALDAVLQADAAAAEALQGEGIDKELRYVDGQVAKMLADPKLRAEFLRWEFGVLAPYGVTPARQAVFFGSDKPSPEEGLADMKVAPAKVKARLATILSKDIGKYAGGLADMISGGAIVVGDIAVGETWLSILSIPGGAKQFVEGWTRFFG